MEKSKSFAISLLLQSRRHNCWDMEATVSHDREDRGWHQFWPYQGTWGIVPPLCLCKLCIAFDIRSTFSCPCPDQVALGHSSLVGNSLGKQALPDKYGLTEKSVS